jgi:hypothetical protein
MEMIDVIRRPELPLDMGTIINLNKLSHSDVRRDVRELSQEGVRRALAVLNVESKRPQITPTKALDYLEDANLPLALRQFLLKQATKPPTGPKPHKPEYVITRLIRIVFCLPDPANMSFQNADAFDNKAYEAAVEECQATLETLDEALKTQAKMKPELALRTIHSLITLCCHNFLGVSVLHKSAASVLATMFEAYPETITSTYLALPIGSKIKVPMTSVEKLLVMAETAANSLAVEKESEGSKSLLTCLYALDGVKTAFDADPENAPQIALSKLELLCQGPLRKAFEKKPEIGPRLIEKLEPLRKGPGELAVAALLRTLKEPRPQPVPDCDFECEQEEHKNQPTPFAPRPQRPHSKLTETERKIARRFNP